MLLQLLGTTPKLMGKKYASHTCQTTRYFGRSHFKDCQDLSNRLKVELIRIYGISGHRKGEVDHVGGIAKVAIRREVAAGKFLYTAAEMVDFLGDNFAKKEHPRYAFQKVTSRSDPLKT